MLVLISAICNRHIVGLEAYTTWIVNLSQQHQVRPHLGKCVVDHVEECLHWHAFVNHRS
jgi:hypothetical protein